MTAVLRADRQRVRGEVNWVPIDLEKEDSDHLISPQERERCDGTAVNHPPIKENDNDSQETQHSHPVGR